MKSYRIEDRGNIRVAHYTAEHKNDATKAEMLLAEKVLAPRPIARTCRTEKIRGHGAKMPVYFFA